MPPAEPLVRTGSYIAVGGNLGSGKTTLTRALAAHLGVPPAPSRSYDQSYIQDQHSDPQRWSFEAQLAFLLHKTSAIRSALDTFGSCVVDRSPYEEIEIFGKHWADRGDLNERGFKLYRHYACLALDQVPPPALLVFCKAPWRICEARLQSRPRPYQTLYPADHLRRLENAYQEWRSHFAACPVVDVDTVALDTRERSAQVFVAESVISELAAIKRPDQLLLPIGHAPDQEVDPHTVVRRASAPPKRGRDFSPAASPSVYIAAGFTALEEEVGTSSRRTDQLQFPIPARSRRIPRGYYRNSLRHIADSFERIGYSAILPHRDVSEWGAGGLTQEEIVEACIRLVGEADLFFGLLGTSFGSHTEAGIAIAQRKPTILVGMNGEIAESFFGAGLRRSRFVATVSVASLRELPSLIESDDFSDVLSLAGAAAHVSRRRL